MTTAVVVPCYNEATRLAADVFADFSVAHPQTRFVFVDDGSDDGTGDILSSLVDRDPDRHLLVELHRNRGKAEAVRAGMQVAFSGVPTYAGYWDADLATPLDEILQFTKIMEESREIEAVFGSRVKLLGRSIRRSSLRHYGGRVFATLVSIALDLGIYDSQCGAKLFRVSPEIEELFREPFLTNWTFDVEILARWTRARRATSGPGPGEVVVERPVAVWHDAPGSSVSALDFFRGIVELARIRRTYLK